MGKDVRHSFRVTLGLFFAVAVSAAVALSTTSVQAHGDEVHSGPKEPPPPDALVLSDVMRLVGMDFNLVRQEAGKIGVDARTQAQVVEATQNAQRYLRVAQLTWAPDDEFREFAGAAIAAWGTVESAAQARDVATLKNGLAPLGETCKACHDVYNKDT